MVNPNYPQLQSQPVIDLGFELEQEFHANAELVAREQTKLIDKIRDIDQQVATSSEKMQNPIIVIEPPSDDEADLSAANGWDHKDVPAVKISPNPPKISHIPLKFVCLC